jgi:hypothetical protein
VQELYRRWRIGTGTARQSRNRADHVIHAHGVRTLGIIPRLIDEGGLVSMNPISRQAATLGASAVLLVVALAVPGAQALDKPGTISVTDSELRHAHIDLGTPGTSVGDLDVYTSLIYNKRITPRAIGRGTMTCTAVSLTSQNCSATYVLPRGEIVTEGVIGSRLIYQLAVVGGTGLYNNVRGSLTVTSLHRKRPSRELLVFRLVV